MSVTNESSKISYEITESLSYSIPFYFEKSNHLKVFIDNEPIEAGFTVSGEGEDIGGSIAFAVVPEGSLITILRQIPVTQENTLNDGGPLDANVFESMFDKLTYLIQQVSENIGRAIKLPLSSEGLSPQLTGTAIPNAMLVVNEDASGLKMGPDYLAFSAEMDSKVLSAQNAATAAETLLDDALESAQEKVDEAALSASSALDSASSASASADTATAKALELSDAVDLINGFDARMDLWEIPVSMGSLVSDIDWSLGNSFFKDVSSDQTFTFSNLVEGKTISVVITNTSMSAITITMPTLYREIGTLSISAESSAIYTLIRINGKTYMAQLLNLVQV